MEKTLLQNGGRAVLIALMGIHLILLFTPINPRPKLRIVIASLLLGPLFGWLAWRSLMSPRSSFVAALGLLLVVYLISALSGASPIAEGWGVKLVFAIGLLAAIRASPIVALGKSSPMGEQ